jgi:hypothetical protein
LTAAAGITASVPDPLIDAEVAEITAVPKFWAKATPGLVIAATVGLAEAQVAELVRS